MHPTVRGVAILARAALATALISGCTSAPPESAPPGGSNQPPSSGLPVATTLETPRFTPVTTQVAIHWEEISGPEDALVYGLVAGPAGFVAIGHCQPAAAFGCPTAWSSPDGMAWAAHPVPAVERAAFSEIASGRGGYVISGFDGQFESSDDDDGKLGTPTIWRSPDGVAWERVGHVGLDACCPDIAADWVQPWTVGLAPSGDIVAGYYGTGLTSSGPLVLGGSGDWEAIEPSAFGLDTFHLDHVFSTQSEVVLFGGRCMNCPEGAWSSTDGRSWTRVADLTIPTERVDSVATDGRHTVAALGPCLLWRYPSCGSQIWAADDGGGWSVRLDLPSGHLRVVSTGSSFVAIGSDANAKVVLGSVDGSTWTHVERDVPECAGDRFAAHNDVVVASCGGGWWRGTVEVVPGTRIPLPTPGPTPTPPPTLDPSLAFEASITLDASCRYDAEYVEATFEIAWSGEVAIDGFDTYIDGTHSDGAGFTPATSSGQRSGFFLTPGAHVVRVEFEADLGERFPGPIVRTIEQTFDINPSESCD